MNVTLHNVVTVIGENRSDADAHFSHARCAGRILLYREQKHGMGLAHVGSKNSEILTSISSSLVHGSFPFHLCECNTNYTCFHVHTPLSLCSFLHGRRLFAFLQCLEGPRTRAPCIDTDTPSRQADWNFQTSKMFRFRETFEGNRRTGLWHGWAFMKIMQV